MHRFARQKGKKKSWQVPMASLSSTWASSRRWQEGWHKTCFLQAYYLGGTWLLRSLSILPDDVIPDCHLVYSERAVLQTNTLFNCRSRYRAILRANACDTLNGIDVGREAGRDQSCHHHGACEGGRRRTTWCFKKPLCSAPLKTLSGKALRD